MDLSYLIITKPESKEIFLYLFSKGGTKVVFQKLFFDITWLPNN
jgi:hypothetical protein